MSPKDLVDVADLRGATREARPLDRKMRSDNIIGCTHRREIVAYVGMVELHDTFRALASIQRRWAARPARTRSDRDVRHVDLRCPAAVFYAF